jgi:hypothetical protein
MAQRLLTSAISRPVTQAALTLEPRWIFTRKKTREKRSGGRRKSLSSIAIKSVDKKSIALAVRFYVAGLRTAHPEVEKVMWFGSWINGLQTPGATWEEEFDTLLERSQCWYKTIVTGIEITSQE